MTIHLCPVRDCKVSELDPHWHMCERHWQMVPLTIQTALIKWWNHGIQYLAWRDHAIRLVERQIP